MSNDATTYLNSQLGRVIERMKIAKLSGKPIVLLHTNDLDFVSDLIHSESIIPDVYPVANALGKIQRTSSIVYDLKTPDLTQPTLFVLFTEEPARQEGTKLDKLLPDLERFLRNYADVAIRRDIFSGKRPDKEERLRQVEAVRQSLVLIVSADRTPIPASIALYTACIDVPPMQESELRACIAQEMLAIDGAEPQNDICTDYYARCMKGMSRTKIRQLLREIAITAGSVRFDSCKSAQFRQIERIILNEKRQLVASSEILSWEGDTQETPATGLDQLARYLKSHAQTVNDFDRFRRQRHMEFPKGVLVSGIPGSGKSLMAKYSAHLLGLPLIKMDMGNVLNKYVGGSEQRMTDALDLIGALAPCVLWIDEIEKAFAGSSDGHETTQRLFGKFLTWMQEKEKKDIRCFVFATANSIKGLPPELFRSGRFDAKYSVFMPTAAECSAIFESHIAAQCLRFEEAQKNDRVEPGLRRKLFDRKTMNASLFIQLLNDRGICLKKFVTDDKTVTRENKFFTGADIETLIKLAKEKFLDENYGSAQDDVVYNTTDFTKCLRLAIGDMKTYGETNLMDIAVCYARLAVNTFIPASGSDIMPFKGYDELRKEALYTLKTAEDIEKEKEQKHLITEETKHENKLEHDYDRCLFRVVRNLLNSESEEIKKNTKK